MQHLEDAAHYVAIKGANLEYRWAGNFTNDASPIVMLHEGLGSMAMWRDFPDRLAEQTGRRVFVYSRQGYGNSSPVTEKRDPDYMHVEGKVILPALLNQMGIQRPVLFGHSDGGSIAILYASHCDDASALILEAPHVFVEELTVQSIAKAKSAFQSTDLKSKLARYHADPEASFWGWNDIWLDSRFLEWNIEQELTRVRCPISLIQGADDQYGTQAQLNAIGARVKQTEILVLDNCGHSPHRDHPDIVLDRTRAFVARLA